MAILNKILDLVIENLIVIKRCLKMNDKKTTYFLKKNSEMYACFILLLSSSQLDSYPYHISFYNPLIVFQLVIFNIKYSVEE